MLPPSVNDRRNRPIRLALIALLVVSCALASACAQDTPSSEMPALDMIVLADQNRMVWLSQDDDDQRTVGEPIWDVIGEAEDVSDGATVARESVDTAMRTGKVAALYFREGLPNDKDGRQPVGVIVIMAPGESADLKKGDVLHLYAKAVYRVVGSMPASAV